jgi:tetratricopeptide (TPR) repeat protein
VVVTGTVLSAGDQLRVSAQLLSAPGGEVIWSDVWTAPRTELFTLQDSAATRIARALPATRAEPTPSPQDRPASSRAYELYLRANQVSYEPTMWRRSADLYEQCVQEDPDFAPAWARLGRLYRVFAKYELDDPVTSLQKAEAAFGRALALSPDLALAHQLYAQLEVEMGRAEDALRRLLPRAAGRRPDPDLLAGLVHACRYVDLLDASCAAHEIAKRLDPNAQTSVLHTWFLMGRFDLIAAEQHRSTDPVVGVALAAMGRRDEALAVFKAEEERFGARPTLKEFATAAAAALEGRHEDARALASFDRPSFRDGEGIFYFARILSFARDGDAALRMLERAVDLGFGSSTALQLDPWLEPIRSDPRFAELDARCRARHAKGKQVFIEHGGETLLGIRAG